MKLTNVYEVCIKCGTPYWGRLCDNCYPSPIPEMKAEIDRIAESLPDQNRSFTLEEIGAMESGAQG